MTNAEYYKNRPEELAEKLDRILERGSSWTTRTDGERITEFLCGDYKGEPNSAKGETTFIVTLDVSNTISGTIENIEQTADMLETLYLSQAKAALKSIFGDARDADDVSVRYTKVYTE